MQKIIEKYKNLNIVVKASIWFTLCSIIQKGISVITLPIFTRIMSIEQYGEYNIYLTWYNIILIIVTLNIHSEIFNKGLSEHSSNMDRYTANQSGLLTILTLIFLVIYLIFHKAINNLLNISTLLMIVMLAEIWESSIISFWRAQKRFEYSYKIIVIVSLLCTIFSPIIGIIAVLISAHKVEAKVISTMLIPFVVAVVIFFLNKEKKYCLKNIVWWKKSVLLSLPLIPHYLSLILLNQSDKLMINHFNGSAKAAIYSVAYSAGFLMVIINNSINNSFVPWCYNKLKENNFARFNTIISSMIFIVMVMNLLLIWIAPECIKIFAPSEYSSAIWCLVPIAMSVFFSYLYTLCVDFEIYFEKNHYIAIASIFATILNLLLNYIFIPKYGFLVAGYTTLISYIAMSILHYIFLLKVLKNNDIKPSNIFNMKHILALIILIFIFSIIAMLLYSYLYIRLGVIILICVIVFLLRNKIISIFKELKK